MEEVEIKKETLHPLVIEVPELRTMEDNMGCSLNTIIA
jgi:hypothetical protein